MGGGRKLYNFIGLNINSEEVQRYLINFGEYKTWNFSNNIIDYHYEYAGIQFRTYQSGEIIVIFCFNKNSRLINQPIRFIDDLPFNLTFDDEMEEINNKLGEGHIYRRYGFYGRTFKWTIEDSLNIYIQMELPRKENDKLYIEQISISKNIVD